MLLVKRQEVFMFINRKAELEQLNRLNGSDHAELLVLYGRRRVGKTLVKHPGQND